MLEQPDPKTPQNVFSFNFNLSPSKKPVETKKVEILPFQQIPDFSKKNSNKLPAYVLKQSDISFHQETRKNGSPVKRNVPSYRNTTTILAPLSTPTPLGGLTLEKECFISGQNSNSFLTSPANILVFPTRNQPLALSPHPSS